VLDTNIVLSALLWNGAPWRLLHSAQHGTIEFFTSQELVDELADVLARRKCSRRLLEMDLSASQILTTYSDAVQLVDPAVVPRIAPDPDDDVVIGTAIAAKAGRIVTGDKMLLSVGQYQGVRIVSVAEALQAIAQDVSPDAP
jgi:putative PIN family toxin of toxin-antitoxin system